MSLCYYPSIFHTRGQNQESQLVNENESKAEAHFSKGHLKTMALEFDRETLLLSSQWAGFLKKVT